jgi:hypothetical protein
MGIVIRKARNIQMHSLRFYIPNYFDIDLLFVGATNINQYRKLYHFIPVKIALRWVIHFYCIALNICDLENIFHINVSNINEIYILAMWLLWIVFHATPISLGIWTGKSDGV